MNIKSHPLFGKRPVGLCAAAAPIVLLLSFLIGPSMAISNAPDLLATVAAHRTDVIAQAVLLLAATLLFVPVFFGLLHLTPEKGSTATRLAAGLFTVGIVGHSGLAFLRLAIVQISGAGHPHAMVALTDHLSHGVLLALLPLLSAFDLALILLFVGLHRARLAPGWTVALAVSIAVSAGVLGASKPSFLIAGVLGTVLGGWMSKTILALPASNWRQAPEQARQRPELQAA